MKNHFVKTTNYLRFRATVLAVEARGAQEAGWILVTGLPGTGKTALLRRWAADTGAVYLMARKNWTVSYFLQDLAEALGIEATGHARKRDALIIGKVAREQIPIVVDEIEHCFAHGHAVLEQIRTISDASETLIVLAGMEDERRQAIQATIARHMQFGSRVFQAFSSTPATLEDVKKFADELSEIAIGDDLVAAIHQQSRGIYRPIKNAISKCERTGKRGNLAVVGLSDMTGQELCPDWQAKRNGLMSLEARP